MAQQAARESDIVPDFVDHFAQRIQALAQSQDLLLRQDWQGAWLNDLVMAHLDLFGIRQRTLVEPPRDPGTVACIADLPIGCRNEHSASP